MSRPLGPVAASLDELRGHLEQQSSGTFYLVGSDDKVAAIVLASGVVEAVSFQGRNGDFAVELLKSMKSASCTFRRAPPRPAKESGLSQRAIRWLIGANASAVRPGPRARAAGPAVDRYRSVIEAASFAYFGPIAGVVCDAAFAGADDLNRVIDELAAKLAPEEGAAFRVAIARSIDEAPLSDGAGGNGQVTRQRQAIEAIAFAFLGPIAGVVCDKAFAEGHDLMRVIDEVAGKLSPNEAANFRSEVARETGVN